MMKEFRFEPASQMITVEEGQSLNIDITGIKTAYRYDKPAAPVPAAFQWPPNICCLVPCSCYGAVQSLSGDAERDVAVEAVGQDECSLYSEDTVTDEEGRFRLRGLLVRVRCLQIRWHPQQRPALLSKWILNRCDASFQPGCKYLIQLRAEGNDHIERALPQHRAVQV